MARLGSLWSRVTPRHFAWQAWHLVTSTFVSRGRRGTISHPPSFCVVGPLWHHLTHIFVTHHLSHRLCHTPSVIQSLSTILSRTSLSHTICHIPSFTHTLSHTNFHTQLCRTPSFTYDLSQYNTLVCSSLVRMSVSSTSRFGSSKSDWSRKPFGHQIHVSFASMFT